MTFDPPAPLAYSIKEAVRLSSISRTHLYALIKAHKIKVTKVGNRTLVNAASLRQLIEPTD
jgi:excisionase family DNA binding protein